MLGQLENVPAVRAVQRAEAAEFLLEHLAFLLLFPSLFSFVSLSARLSIGIFLSVAPAAMSAFVFRLRLRLRRFIALYIV